MRRLGKKYKQNQYLNEFFISIQSETIGFLLEQNGVIQKIVTKRTEFESGLSNKLKDNDNSKLTG